MNIINISLVIACSGHLFNKWHNCFFNSSSPLSLQKNLYFYNLTIILWSNVKQVYKNIAVHWVQFNSKPMFLSLMIFLLLFLFVFCLYCSSSMKTKLPLGNPNIFPSLIMKMRLWCNYYYSGPSMKRKAEYISFLWVSFYTICLNAVVILGLPGTGFWKHMDSLLPKLSLEMLRMVETKPCVAGFSFYSPNFFLLVEIIGKI